MNIENNCQSTGSCSVLFHVILPTQLGSEETVLTHTHISMDTSPPGQAPL